MQNQNVRLERLVRTALKEHGALNITLVYEEAVSRKWARDLYERMEKVAGRGKIRPTWWNLRDLEAPGVLAGAVSTALRAEFIVVATRAVEGLPLPFYVWVNAWLPHRFHSGGALISVLGSQSENAQDNAGDYLREVARQGRMDFVLQRRRTPRRETSMSWLQNLACASAEPMLN